MKILNQFPISPVETVVSLPGGRCLTAKPYQVIVTVSLTVRETISPAFPAFLDSGHNHNFSISEEHLRVWAGIDPNVLRPMLVVPFRFAGDNRSF